MMSFLDGKKSNLTPLSPSLPKKGNPRIRGQRVLWNLRTSCSPRFFNQMFYSIVSLSACIFSLLEFVSRRHLVVEMDVGHARRRAMQRFGCHACPGAGRVRVYGFIFVHWCRPIACVLSKRPTINHVLFCTIPTTVAMK